MSTAAPRRRIAIVVPALAARGGLPALAFFLYRTLSESQRYEPHLISVATSSSDANSIRLADPRTWWRGVRATADEVAGVPFLHVGAAGAEIEVLRYQPRAALTELLNAHDLVQLIGGSPAFAHVARDVEKPVALYVATLVEAERRSLLRDTGLVTQWRRLMTSIVSRMDTTGLRHVDTVFVINAWMRDRMSAVLGPGRVHLSPPGIDTDLFQLGEVHRDDVILTVGRLDDPRKNIPLLIDAFAKVRSRLERPIRLILAGERAPSEKALETARRLGVMDAIDVRLKLEPAELAALYQSATIFALSSDEEGLGIVALEAMSCGVPVVATRCGGPDITVVDGETGFLVSIGDANAMAERLESLLTDRALRNRMGAASRRRVEQRFSLRSTGDVFLEVYDRMLSSQRSSPKGRAAS